MEQTDIGFRKRYYKLVIAGYTALAALFLFVLHVPNIFRIAFLVIAVALVSVPMYLGRASVAGSHTDYDTDAVAGGDK